MAVCQFNMFPHDNLLWFQNPTFLESLREVAGSWETEEQLAGFCVMREDRLQEFWVGRSPDSACINDV